MTRRRRVNPRQRAIAKGYRSGLEEKIGEQLKKLEVNAEYESFKIPLEILYTRLNSFRIS